MSHYTYSILLILCLKFNPKLSRHFDRDFKWKDQTLKTKNIKLIAYLKKSKQLECLLLGIIWVTKEARFKTTNQRVSNWHLSEKL